MSVRTVMRSMSWIERRDRSGEERICHARIRLASRHTPSMRVRCARVRRGSTR
jgi:hypothetical protein